jgi:hypothetical protein
MSVPSSAWRENADVTCVRMREACRVAWCMLLAWRAGMVHADCLRAGRWTVCQTVFRDKRHTFAVPIHRTGLKPLSWVGAGPPN